MGQACFFQYDNYSGASFCVSPGQGVLDLRTVGMDNKISSAIIPAGYSVTVYKSINFQGEATVFMGMIPDISAYGYGWDNAISSLQFNP